MEFTYNNQKFKLILFTLAGSRFYGTEFNGQGTDKEHPLEPDYVSDHDWRGVFVADPDTKIGLSNTINDIQVKKGKNGDFPQEYKDLIDDLNEKLADYGVKMDYDTDIILYEIKKFIEMSLKNNPNILDILYADDDSIFYKESDADLILDNKNIFMSKLTKHTFSGYAASQLSRIRGHYKWLSKYPKVNDVLDVLKNAYSDKKIDFNWITDHFGGRVSEFVTGLKQKDINNKGKTNSIGWEEFLELYCNDKVSSNDLKHYRKPQLIDYCTAKDLRAKKYPLETSKPHEISPFKINATSTLKEFLLNEASFRTVSGSLMNIFTPNSDTFNGGIFGRNGDLKSNDPEEVGEFVCQLSIDKGGYSKDLHDIQEMWKWRTQRNTNRSKLEKKFGYDTKHAAHLFRLLLGAEQILKTGEYEPRLSGKKKSFIRDILAGKYSYEWIVVESEKIDKGLDEIYNKSNVKHSPDHKKANQILLDISKRF